MAGDSLPMAEVSPLLGASGDTPLALCSTYLFALTWHIEVTHCAKIPIFALRVNLR